jgi:uncharacterized protein YbjT (DUF2867 family)
MSKTILITGANGNVSSSLIAALKGTKNTIRAMVRNPAAAEKLKAQGVETCIGDFELPSTLTKAFEGVDAAWLLTNNGPRSPEHMSKAIYAARKACVPHVVRMSAIGAAYNAPTINSRLHAMSDAELAASGLPYTVVKPHFFMQNLMMFAQSVAKEGTLYAALSDARMGMVDTRDIAEFAAKVLTTGGHEGKTYVLTGPASISMNQVAEHIGTAIKKPVKYTPVSVEQACASMAKMGMDAYAVNMMADYFTAYSANWGDLVSSDFQNLMGKAPRSIADFSKDFGAAFSSSN